MRDRCFRGLQMQEQNSKDENWKDGPVTVSWRKPSEVRPADDFSQPQSIMVKESWKQVEEGLWVPGALKSWESLAGWGTWWWEGGHTRHERYRHGSKCPKWLSSDGCEMRSPRSNVPRCHLMRDSDNPDQTMRSRFLVEETSKASWPTQNLRLENALTTRGVRMPSCGQQMTSESNRIVGRYVSSPSPREGAKSDDWRTRCERDNG